MPTPDQKPPEAPGADARRAMLEHQMTAASFTGRPKASLDDVLVAVRVMTEEVRRLRDAIEPPATALIVGPAALQEYRRITGRPS